MGVEHPETGKSIKKPPQIQPMTRTKGNLAGGSVGGDEGADSRDVLLAFFTVKT